MEISFKWKFGRENVPHQRFCLSSYPTEVSRTPSLVWGDLNINYPPAELVMGRKTVWNWRSWYLLGTMGTALIAREPRVFVIHISLDICSLSVRKQRTQNDTPKCLPGTLKADGWKELGRFNAHTCCLPGEDSWSPQSTLNSYKPASPQQFTSGPDIRWLGSQN